MENQRENAMECPVCHGIMRLGRLYAPESSSVYWYPDDQKLDCWVLTGKKVTDNGGLVLGRTHRFTFLSKDRPETWHCPQCRLLITCLEPSENE